MVPDFIIPGTAKSGTTSLANLLRQHPKVFMHPDAFEPHFFNRQDKYEKGISFYSKFFKDAKQGQLIGEKTPRYAESGVAERMHRVLPDVKLIWIFRNPVYRAYSHYKMYVWRGVEDRTFEEAIAGEEKNVGRQKSMMNYKALGKYSEQIREYLQCFKKDQMHFIIFEKFVASPEECLRQIEKFLNIEPYNGYSRQHKLKAKWPKDLLFQQKARKISFGPGEPCWEGLIPRRFCNAVFNMLVAGNVAIDGAPRIEEKIRSELESFYVPFNQSLSELIGEDVSSYWG